LSPGVLSVGATVAVMVRTAPVGAVMRPTTSKVLLDPGASELERMQVRVRLVALLQVQPGPNAPT
jgi:hypothetical protein